MLKIKEEPIYDIRNTIPEIKSDVEISGNISEIMSKEEWIYLRNTNYIAECGYYEGIKYIRLHNLFTVEDIKNKIEEICRESR